MRYLTLLIILITISIEGLAQVNDHDMRFYTLMPYGGVLEDNKILPQDHYIGNIHAPIMMIEYASFSCIHCATFSQDVLPLIQQLYIDTGKVLFVYRDFPLDKPALKAAMLAKCYASDKYCEDSCEEEHDYFSMYHALFNSLTTWAYANDVVNKLRDIAKIGKMSTDRFYKCIKDQAIQEQIINSKIYAIRHLDISSTPVFIINGKKYVGAHDFKFFSKIFDEIIKVSQKKDD